MTETKPKEKEDVFIAVHPIQFGHGDDRKGTSHNDCTRVAAGQEFRLSDVPEFEWERALKAGYIRRKDSK